MLTDNILRVIVHSELVPSRTVTKPQNKCRKIRDKTAYAESVLASVRNDGVRIKRDNATGYSYFTNLKVCKERIESAPYTYFD